MTRWALLALLLAVGAATAGPVEYEFVALPKLHPDGSSTASTVNDRGQVSGTARTNAIPAERAVLWNVAPDGSATVTDIGLVAGRPMFGGGVNNHGHIVGVSIPAVGQFGYRWTGGTPAQLENAFETPPGGGTFATSAIRISDRGWIGGSACASANENVGPWNAVLWDPEGAMHALGTLGGEWSFGFGVNERDMACGRSEFSFTTFATRGFRWTPDTGMQSLAVLPDLGHVSSQGRGMNNHGDVAGTSSAQLFLFGPDTLGVVWYADGTTRTLDAIGTPGTDDEFSDAWDINDAGWVVGTSSLGTFLEHAHPILWLPDGSRVDLLSLLPAGADWASAISISNSGWIAGLYRTGGATAPPTAYVLRPTPATQVAMLMDQVDRLDLGRVGTGLNLQLDLALAKLDGGKPRAAAALLSAVACEVKMLGRLGKLDAVEADALLAVVNAAIATLAP